MKIQPYFNSLLICLRVDQDNIFGSIGGNHFQSSDLPVLDMTLNSGLVRGVQFEISRPIVRLGGQNLDAFAIALQNHELERGHAGTAVVHVGNPVAVF